ncbi:MAG: MBL fold metallo-hydrolase RNA specificity domain-containing protein [Candidatus Woesearchaeota archaeon]
MKYSIDGIFTIDAQNGDVIPSANGTNNIMISHAHYDHIPSTIRKKTVIASDKTMSIVTHRLSRKKLEDSIHKNIMDGITMMDAGHTIGSKMFYYSDQRILYTGDFRTVNSYCGRAKPIRCNTLIIESTFADEKYIFPKHSSILREIADYAKDNGRVQFHAYPYGKAQELCHLMEENNILFSVTEKIRKINDLLGLHYKNETDNARVHIGNDRMGEYKQVGVTGWAIDPSYKHRLRLDEAFALSDHADYPSMIEFIRKCDPQRIYTFHGHSARFAAKLRKAGYNAYPIIKNQTILPYYDKAL